MRKLYNGLALVATAAAVIIPATLAQGASSSPPTVTTSAATNVSDGGATLNGIVNPNGQQTSYAFQWGPTTGYGHETTLTSAGSGSTAQTVNAVLSGLSPGTAYHYRIIATNASGTSVGSDQSFKTGGTAPPPSTPPTASTGSATNLNQSGATVNGTVDPGGQATSYYFEYGPTSNYGFQTAATSGGSGVDNEPVSANLDGLASSTTYHYRLVAVSAGGTALGSDQTFTTTTPPAATTGTATQIRKTAVVLNGTVDPKGQATTYYFQYGTSTAYGLQTSPASAGSGGGNVAVHSELTGLTTNTIYHYRIIAESAGGTSYGADQTVTVGQPQSQVRFMGRMGFVSPGRIIGVEAGCFGGDAYCAGHVTMSHNGIVIGQGDFNIAPDSGGFQNIEISRRGEQMLTSYNNVFHLLPVTVSVSTPSGQKTSQVMHLARWIWH
jgi:hypothetical protein